MPDAIPASRRESGAVAGSLQPRDPQALPRGEEEAGWGLRDGGCCTRRWRRGVPGGALGAYTGAGGTRTASAAVANHPKRSRRAEPALQGLWFIVKLPRAPVLTERSVGPLAGGTEAWDDSLLIRDPAAQKGLRGGIAASQPCKSQRAVPLPRAPGRAVGELQLLLGVPARRPDVPAPG